MSDHNFAAWRPPGTTSLCSDYGPKMHVGAPTHHHAHPQPPMGPASSSRFRDAFAAAKKQYGPVPGGPGSPHQQRPFLR